MDVWSSGNRQQDGQSNIKLTRRNPNDRPENDLPNSSSSRGEGEYSRFERNSKKGRRVRRVRTGAEVNECIERRERAECECEWSGSGAQVERTVRKRSARGGEVISRLIEREKTKRKSVSLD